MAAPAIQSIIVFARVGSHDAQSTPVFPGGFSNRLSLELREP
jgi:hypothetical protein